VQARWSLLAGVLAIDQLTKWWAVESLADNRAIDLVGSLQLKLAINHGSAFSLAQGRGALISLLALVIVAVLVRSGRYATRPASAVAIGLVVGGALGNLVDRAFREGDGFLGGGVVDFIDLQWWPVFNVADSAIVVGAILLFLVEAREAPAK
jgi:signal peptidase II